MYWVCVIYVSVLRFYNISKNSKIERILLRKYYHLMAVSMFLPALIFQVIRTMKDVSFVLVHSSNGLFINTADWHLLFSQSFLI